MPWLFTYVHKNIKLIEGKDKGVLLILASIYTHNHLFQAQ